MSEDIRKYGRATAMSGVTVMSGRNQMQPEVSGHPRRPHARRMAFSCLLPFCRYSDSVLRAWGPRRPSGWASDFPLARSAKYLIKVAARARPLN